DARGQPGAGIRHVFCSWGTPRRAPVSPRILRERTFCGLRARYLVAPSTCNGSPMLRAPRILLNSPREMLGSRAYSASSTGVPNLHVLAVPEGMCWMAARLDGQ